MRSKVVSGLARFLGELSRRKVTRTAAAYVVMGFVVMQVVDDVLPYVPGLPAGTGTLILVLLAIGFPLTLGLAWALEWTPQGIRRELTAEMAGAATVATPPTPASTMRTRRKDSLVVLPFENLSVDPSDEYFSDGITEDITAALARISGLRVLSRGSAMQYKGTTKTLAEIADELGVATIIEGSVRRSAQKIRVVVDAVDAGSHEVLWSETYDREPQDIFAVQSEVAEAVARAMQRELSSANAKALGTRGTRDVEAYDLYLRGRFHWNERSEAAVMKSIAFFERAIERDPTFALAYAGLADASTVLGIYGVRPPSEIMEAGKQSALQALALDPTLGEAWASLACVRGLYDWQWEEAETGFRSAIAAAPSYATAHQWYALNLLVPRRRFVEAAAELDRAEDLDPRSTAIAVSRGILSFYARDYAAAMRAQETVVGQYPRSGLAHLFLGMCLEATRRSAEAIEALNRSVTLSDESGETLAALGHALGASGRLAEAREVLERLEKRRRARYVSPALLAQVRLGLGDRESAMDLLEEAARVRATDLAWLGVRPVYDPLRRERRFQDLMGRVGLPD
jgi:TolB-like protein/Tfp pilus assembly protein PilF